MIQDLFCFGVQTDIQAVMDGISVLYKISRWPRANFVDFHAVLKRYGKPFPVRYAVK